MSQSLISQGEVVAILGYHQEAANGAIETRITVQFPDGERMTELLTSDDFDEWDARKCVLYCQGLRKTRSQGEWVDLRML